MHDITKYLALARHAFVKDVALALKQKNEYFTFDLSVKLDGNRAHRIQDSYGIELRGPIWKNPDIF